MKTVIETVNKSVTIKESEKLIRTILVTMVSCSNSDLNSLHSTLVVRKKGAVIPRDIQLYCHGVNCKIIWRPPTRVKIRPTEIGGNFLADNANLKILI